MVRVFCASLLVIVLAGCTTTPMYNQPLTQFSPDAGYRFENVEKKENSDDLFVILTFSGGGSRASALSLGVLEKLAATEIEWNGRKCRLLDEVDLISSVSGGSMTAAYFGAFGDRVFTDFLQKLYLKNNSKLLKAAFALPNMIKQASPLYSRTDTTAKNYSTELFENLTFGDLLTKRTRPFILLNATDMGLGRQFSFTQDYFDLLYSDLSTYPLGNAVAASSAFPGAFTSLVLKNYEKGADFELDPWYQEKIAAQDLGSFPYRTSRDSAAYADPAKKFALLSDGGVSDNLGLLPVIACLGDPDRPMKLVPTIPQGKEQKVVIIAVNAASRPPDTLSYKGQPPGLFKLLGTAGTTPMGWFTEAQLAYLKLFIHHAESIDTPKPGEPLDPSTNAARVARSEAPRRFYFTEVGFDKIADDEERKYYETIPTSFTLVPESVDKLRKIGGELLGKDPVFGRLLNEIGAK